MPTKNLNEAVEKSLEYVLGIASDGKIGKMLPPSDGVDGAPGPQGDPGVAGPAGDSAYEVWLGEGNVGTEADFLLDITGPPGPQGDPGADGVGVPAGGTAGQVLQKVDGTDYNTTWATPSGGGGAVIGCHLLVPVPANLQFDNSINATTAVTVAGVANQCDWMPFIPVRDVTIGSMGVEVTTSVSGAQINCGIYSDNGAGQPNAKLAEVTGLNGGGNGVRIAVLASNFTFTAGTLYWLAVAHTSTATLRAMPIGALMAIGLSNTSGARAVSRRATVSGGTLPSTAPATTLTSASMPHFRMQVV